jgi:hypothetical protein
MEILHYLLSLFFRLKNFLQGQSSNQDGVKSNNSCDEHDRNSDESIPSKEAEFYLFLAIDAERTAEIINEVKKQEKLTQDSVNVLSRTANIEGLWQGTKSEFEEKQIDQYFDYSSNEKDEYDLYLLKIKLNEPEPEFDRSKPATSRSRAFRRLLKKEHSVQISPRLPRESIENNPHLYR